MASSRAHTFAKPLIPRSKTYAVFRGIALYPPPPNRNHNPKPNVTWSGLRPIWSGFFHGRCVTFYRILWKSFEDSLCVILPTNIRINRIQDSHYDADSSKKLPSFNRCRWLSVRIISLKYVQNS